MIGFIAGVFTGIVLTVVGAFIWAAKDVDEDMDGY